MFAQLLSLWGYLVLALVVASKVSGNWCFTVVYLLIVNLSTIFSFSKLSLPISARATTTCSLMSPLTRVIQTGIGLAAELKAASKERKASEAGVEESLTGEYKIPFQ